MVSIDDQILAFTTQVAAEINTLRTQAGGTVPPPVGAIFAAANTTVPFGYLVCDGSAVSRTTYASLFAAIGTAFGVGDGGTTFNLPDLRGRVPVGQDTTQTEFTSLGQTGGEKNHLLTVNEMPSHQHTGVTNTLYYVGSGGQFGTTAGSVVNTNNTSTQLTGSTGGGLAHNNLQPYQVIRYIIRWAAGVDANESVLTSRVGSLEANTNPIRKFAGVNLTIWGHSYTVNNGAYVPLAEEYYTKLAAKHGFNTPVSYGVAGFLAIEAALTAADGYITGASAVAPLPTKGVVIFDCSYNDLATVSGTDPTGSINLYKDGLAYFLARIGASSRTMAYGNGVTRSGSWVLTDASTATHKSFPGHANTTTNGAYVEFTATATDITPICFLYGPGGPSPTYTVSVDGVVKETVVTANARIQNWTSRADSSTVAWSQNPTPQRNLGSGAHTVRVTFTGTTGDNLHVQEFLVGNPTPPVVYIVVDPVPSSIAPAFNNQNKYHDLLVQATKDVITRYPYAKIITLDELNQQTGAFLADGYHPNYVGHTWITNIISKEVQGLTRPPAFLV
jgi:microcystin-dependent protein